MFETLQRWFGRDAQDAPVAIPDALWATVTADLPWLDHLPDTGRARLRELAGAFLERKQFHGAAGLVLTDAIMLSIAVQACLPILRAGIDAYRHWVGIVVYPGDFRVHREILDEDGVVHAGQTDLLGEAWQGGPVIVSWQPTTIAEGVNVVIHEFAHTLDMANGDADGFPPLPADMDRHAWADAFGAAYADLCDRVDHDEPTALDPYASEQPGEFFAVASEVFFERPLDLRAAYPAVYAQLKLLFGVDPAVRAGAGSR